MLKTRSDKGVRSGSAIAALLVLTGIAAASVDTTERVPLPPGPGPLTNPLKGYAPYSGNGAVNTGPVSMAFVECPWKELEPTEGEYRFAEWEKAEWDTPAAKGKPIVFRVWLDYPHQEVGVPSWLLAKGVKMTAYTEFGGGKSPDYENPTLQSAMLKLIEALGRRYDSNPRVAFVQVGLLGHWGEFHTYPRDELFASVATQSKVVAALHAAFPHKQLMGRNPSYPSLRLPWMGFHDDMIPEDTLGPSEWDFLPSMRAGKVDENWRVAPVGGEMVPGAARKWLGEGWDTMKRAVEDAHLTWIGPYCPSMNTSTDPTFRARSEELVQRLGYQFQLVSLTCPKSVASGAKAPVTIEGTNQGVAPFYYEWPVELVLIDADGRIAARRPVASDIRRWQPGPFVLHGSTPAVTTAGTYRLAIGIIDPLSHRSAIQFANKLDQVSGYTVLSSITVTQ